MALSGVGFDGTLLEADWARIAGPQGVPDQSIPGQSATDFAVTLSTTGLSATVAPGSYNRHGILCKSTATETVTFTNPASGIRFDLVALLIDWTTNVVTLTVTQGNSTENVQWAGLEKTIGTKTHVPLALVQLTAGNAAPTLVRDRRIGMWRNPDMATGFTWSGTGADRLRVRQMGDRVDIEGAATWVSGPLWDTTMVVGLPPAPFSHPVGSVEFGNGGYAPLWVNQYGQLYCRGMWQGAGNIDPAGIWLSGSYVVAP